MTMVEKLRPSRFTQMSPKMAAIVGCILGEKYTDPSLAELCITADGFVMGRHSDDCGFNEWIGEASDLERNWRNLLEAAGLTPEETQDAMMHYRVRVQDWRKPTLRIKPLAPAPFEVVEDSRG